MVKIMSICIRNIDLFFYLIPIFLVFIFFLTNQTFLYIPKYKKKYKHICINTQNNILLQTMP
jgi:hypothetical protein